MSLHIGEASRRSGLSPNALRYYEREGLLPSTSRDGSGARLFDDSALDQLAVITSLRAVGFSLAQVRQLLGAKEGTRTVRERVAAARAALDTLDAALDEKERELAAAREHLRSWRSELDSGEPWPDTLLSC